jgi:hypothetical protein
LRAYSRSEREGVGNHRRFELDVAEGFRPQRGDVQFPQALVAYDIDSGCGRKSERCVLGNWIKNSPVRHYHWIAQQNVSESDGLDLWRGAVQQQHLTNSDWVAKERGSDDSRRQLQAFVRAAEPLVEKFQKAGSTQLNESLNSVKSGKTSKKTAWQSSFSSRYAVAIPDFNETHQWHLKACDILGKKNGWPILSQCSRDILENTLRSG